VFNYWSTTDPIEAALAPRILKQLLHLFTHRQVPPNTLPASGASNKRTWHQSNNQCIRHRGHSVAISVVSGLTRFYWTRGRRATLVDLVERVAIIDWQRKL